MKASADLLLLPQWVLPVESDGALADHAVVVADGRIVDLLPAPDAHARYACAETIALPGKVLIPGLVNLHARAASVLLRGLAVDLPHADARARLDAAERALLSEAFVRDGTLVAIAEMLAGGITHCCDTYFFPNGSAEAFLEAGMQATIGMPVRETPTACSSGADDAFARGLALRDTHKDDARLNFAFHAHADLSDATLVRLNTLAEQLGVPVSAAVHENADAVAAGVRQFGVRPVERLARLGLLGPSFLALHAVHVDAAEIGLLARHGCHVAHSPAAELSAGAGIAPVAGFLHAGVNVGLGSGAYADGDLFAAMRLAALLAKGVSGDASAMPAAATLRAATLSGATALGLEHELGSIAPGKRANLVAVDLSRAADSTFDPVSQLVYVAHREDVTHVWVDGRLKLNERCLVDLDVDDITARARYWRGKLTGRGSS